jgi:hypothetical protein
VVPHHKPKEKHHNHEHDPVYIGTGEIKQHTVSLSENLTKWVTKVDLLSTVP